MALLAYWLWDYNVYLERSWPKSPILTTPVVVDLHATSMGFTIDSVAVIQGPLHHEAKVWEERLNVIRANRTWLSDTAATEFLQPGGTMIWHLRRLLEKTEKPAPDLSGVLMGVMWHCTIKKAAWNNECTLPAWASEEAVDAAPEIDVRGPMLLKKLRRCAKQIEHQIGEARVLLEHDIRSMEDVLKNERSRTKQQWTWGRREMLTKRIKSVAHYEALLEATASEVSNVVQVLYSANHTINGLMGLNIIVTGGFRDCIESLSIKDGLDQLQYCGDKASKLRRDFFADDSRKRG